jgi:hypothetical protein
MESAAGRKERGSPGLDDTIKAAGISTLLQAAPYPNFEAAGANLAHLGLNLGYAPGGAYGSFF